MGDWAGTEAGDAAPDDATRGTEPAPPVSVDLIVDQGYTLDQLEQLSGVPGRTIRFYRQSGLIERPRRVGRNAYYAPEQLGRLRFIAALRERGEVLRLIGLDEPLVLGGLEQVGLIAGVEGQPNSYEVPSLVVLELAAEMIRAGIAAEVSTAAWATMQSRMAGLADELVTLFAEHPDHGFAGNDTAAEISEGYRQLRPIALRAIQVAFGQEIQRALAGYLALAANPDAIVPHRAASPTDPV